MTGCSVAAGSLSSSGSPLSHFLDGLGVVGLNNKLAESVNEGGDDGLVYFLELNVLPLNTNVKVNILQLLHSLVDLNNDNILLI